MTTMHAVRGHARGGPEQLRYETAPRPEPGPGDLLVEVRSAAITPGELDWDATWTDALDSGGTPRLPIVPSKEFSGVVAAAGPAGAPDAGAGAPVWSEGDEVYGLIPFTSDGAAAQYAVVPADVVAAKPAGLDHDHAAALPLAGLTALQALVTHGGLREGQRVLVHGGAGGVGSLAVQIAAALGAEVTATASARDADFVRGLGATRVLDYVERPFDEQVADVDLVLDTVGGDTRTRSWQVLRPGGTLVSVAEPLPAEGPRFTRGVFFVVVPDRAGLDELSRLVAAGRLDPPIAGTYPLSGVAAAYAALARPHRRGKVVLHVSP
ncbi:NADPH:quinone reductase [Actinacidiphila yanglinensis]|uniref:NADPH:quinone reductase n=1 Tax=Actinacidiphila yanglinensis TaxID=310779 RepID=A0A1H6D8V9_9ACTN|nr:NADP-dependent oxidoreductase [Actinacidiphila yanglinensis]SEG81760.1 NADPH:quinone reductase [Actinacidiphila yanglinensis]